VSSSTLNHPGRPGERIDWAACSGRLEAMAKLIRVDSGELRITFVRSSGPGGQNVNKVSTRAMVTFNVNESRSLTDRQRELIRRNLAGRISRTGLLRVSCQRHRTQLANREEAVARLIDVLSAAATSPRPRKRTRVPARAKAKRLADKRHRSWLKELRGRTGREE
jgi:ribosome-associated protein